MNNTLMRSLSSILTSLLLMAGLIAAVPMQSHAQEADTSANAPMMETPDNVVSALNNQEGFNTLADALQRTGLIASLEADGPFTVFAPTDQAFEAVDISTMDEEQLKSILQYHVVSGDLSAEEAAAEGTLTSLHGGTLSIENGMVNGTAKVTESIQTENGVIHVIDSVLSPSQASSL